MRERLDSNGYPIISLSTEDAGHIARRVRESEAEAVAVSLLFSFRNPEHERLIAEALRALDGSAFLSVSSDLLPEYREYERTSTVVINAYVGPAMARYLQRLGDALGPRLRITHSGGGSLSAAKAAQEPVRTLLSGPAGGVMGAFHLASQAGFSQAITLDMGGTSTDVSLCSGRVQETTSAQVGGYPIRMPTIDIHTVGAGGGSIARVDPGGALLVGPQSAGCGARAGLLRTWRPCNGDGRQPGPGPAGRGTLSGRKDVAGRGAGPLLPGEVGRRAGPGRHRYRGGGHPSCQCSNGAGATSDLPGAWLRSAPLYASGLWRRRPHARLLAGRGSGHYAHPGSPTNRAYSLPWVLRWPT